MKPSQLRQYVYVPSAIKGLMHEYSLDCQAKFTEGPLRMITRFAHGFCRHTTSRVPVEDGK